ncbi:Alpha/beta hydrolase fold-1 [Aspergillus similis]
MSTTMSRSESDTVFVLVPGSFSPPSFYDKVTPLLNARGYATYSTALKSVNNAEGPVVTMYEDADHIHKTIAGLADQGKWVILAVNSYGGIPGTQAVQGLSKAERAASGKPGALVGIVYLSSFIAEEGDCVNRIMAGRMPASTQTPTDYLSLDPRNDAEYIFSHIDHAEKAEYANRLEKHSARTFNDPLTYPGYRFVPATYLICTDDNVIPKELQKSMIDAANLKGAAIETRELHSDHCPMISHPVEVVEILLEAAERGRELVGV